MMLVMKNLNKATLIGFTGKDAECRYTPKTNLCIAKFSIATSETTKDKQTGEVKTNTEWHILKAFGKIAEFIRDYVPKGSLIYVEGKLKTERWLDKNQQEKHATAILVDEVILLNPKEKKEPESTISAQDPDLLDDDVDIPF